MTASSGIGALGSGSGRPCRAGKSGGVAHAGVEVGPRRQGRSAGVGRGGMVGQLAPALGQSTGVRCRCRTGSSAGRLAAGLCLGPICFSFSAGFSS
jgi:hypothetical protein